MPIGNKRSDGSRYFYFLFVIYKVDLMVPADDADFFADQGQLRKSAGTKTAE